jgi:hypothetical protein
LWRGIFWLMPWLNGSMAQWLNTAERAAKNGAQGS